MTCFACGADCGDDYSLSRYSLLGYEESMSVCAQCIQTAFPVLGLLEDAEREANRQHEVRQARQGAAMEHLRAAPTPKEYKRRKQEMIEQGLG